MKTLDCHQCFDLLTQAEPERARWEQQIRQHLEHCDACRRVAEDVSPAVFLFCSQPALDAAGQAADTAALQRCLVALDGQLQRSQPSRDPAAGRVRTFELALAPLLLGVLAALSQSSQPEPGSRNGIPLPPADAIGTSNQLDQNFAGSAPEDCGSLSLLPFASSPLGTSAPGGTAAASFSRRGADTGSLIQADAWPDCRRRPSERSPWIAIADACCAVCHHRAEAAVGRETRRREGPPRAVQYACQMCHAWSSSTYF